MTVELQLQEISAVYIQIPEEDLYLLSKTGFNIQLQMDMLPQSASPEDINLWLKKTREDIKAFWLEYLVKLPLLPIPIEIEEGRLVAPEYGQVPLSKTISESERNGTVKESINKIEEFLVNTQPGSVAILTSPPGWSGLVNNQGLPISYPDTQTYIFYKDSEGKVRGFTLVSKLDLDDNEDMLNSFSGLEVNKDLSSKERITSLTATPLSFKSDDKYGFNPEGVVRSIHALYLNSFDLNRVLFLLGNLDNLQHITSHKYVESLIANFEKSVLEISAEDNFTEITAKLLGLTILEISRTTRLLEQEKSLTKTDFIPIYYSPSSQLSPQRNYQSELQYLQAQGGCNGGGNKIGSGLMESSLGVRNINHGEKTLNCTCPFCQTRVTAIISEGRIYCPNCGKSASYKC